MMGHEAIAIVEAVGAYVRILKQGDFVVMPFAFSEHLGLLPRRLSDLVHPRRIPQGTELLGRGGAG